jgi:hypothetical protein
MAAYLHPDFTPAVRQQVIDGGLEMEAAYWTHCGSAWNLINAQLVNMVEALNKQGKSITPASVAAAPAAHRPKHGVWWGNNGVGPKPLDSTPNWWIGYNIWTKGGRWPWWTATGGHKALLETVGQAKLEGKAQTLGIDMPGPTEYKDRYMHSYPNLYPAPTPQQHLEWKRKLEPSIPAQQRLAQKRLAQQRKAAPWRPLLTALQVDAIAAVRRSAAVEWAKQHNSTPCPSN